MTTSKLLRAGITFLAVILAFGFISCSSPTDSSKSNEAALTSLKVAGVTVDPIPDPITAEDWDAHGDLSFLADGQKGEAVIAASNFSDGAAIITGRSSKASVAFAVGISLKQPADDDFESDALDRLINLQNGGWLYIRVTAEDGVAINYYCIRTSSVSSIAILSKIQIADGQEITPTSDNYADTLAGIPSLREVNLNLSQSTNAEITLTPSAAFRGTIEIAKAGAGQSANAVFAPYSADKFDFSDGDELYLKLTAQDAATVRYYGFTILIGRDTSVQTIMVGGAEVVTFGNPKSTLAAAEAGNILMAVVQPSIGFSVNVTPNDSDATVTIGLATEAETNWKAPPQTIRFKDGEFLGVKVVSSSGKVINYYKISVELLDVMYIPYGTPSLTDPDNASNDKYIDPLWNDINWIPVAKQNRAETDQEFYDNPSTKGNAKVYWDEDGLWLYVNVETNYISTNSGYGHLGSSIELFINEAYPAVKTGNYNDIGGQYRYDSNGDTSGDPSAAVTAFTAHNRKNTFRTDKGYVVIFQAPWRFLSAYPLKDLKDISLEIQINAANSAQTSRVGVLKWYNTTANTYQNAAALAPGVLELNGNSLKAMPPNITKHPASQKLTQGETVDELSVTAVSPDNGTLSYQWYSNTTDSYTGSVTTIPGANTATYQPAVTDVGKYYYWVEVTNTLTDSGKSVVSNRATIDIRDPDAFVPDFVKSFDPYLINTEPITDRYRPVLKVDLGEGFDVSNYDRISIDMHFFDKDMNEISSGVNSQATLKWWDVNSTAVASSTDTYNIGTSSFPLVKATIPAGVKGASAAPLRYLDIDSADRSQPSVADADRVVYIQIRSVTFHTPD